MSTPSLAALAAHQPVTSTAARPPVSQSISAAVSPPDTAAATPGFSQGSHGNPGSHGGQAALTLAAIGVVYGDIGTRSLYTVKEIFLPATGVALNAANLVDAVSAIFWALMGVVTLKYVVLILRADNRGEGGGLALTALAAQAVAGRPALRHALLLLGVARATLFYGDSIITPAISVLGAMEGLTALTPRSRLTCCRFHWRCWWGCLRCSACARPWWGAGLAR